MAKSSTVSNKQNDPDLKNYAKSFAEAFFVSHASGKSVGEFDEGSGISLGSAGVVEIDENLEKTIYKLIQRAEQLLGPTGVHSRTFYDLVLQAGHDALNAGLTAVNAAVAIIKKLWDHGTTTYEWVSPNRLFHFDSSIDSVQVGRVRAMKTDVLVKERETQYPKHPVSINISENTGFQLGGGSFSLNLYHTCWLVEVDAIVQHVETEGKWLIDVAVSYLRLRHKSWSHFAPAIGDVEPHPTRPFQRHNEGAKIQGPSITAGGGKSPSVYEIDNNVLTSTRDKSFVECANLIFAPPQKSVAERVSQGLGWLTRGRQAEDRSERLLYFFTAIEALLSSDDKTAPVTQTIARHAAVILTNDNTQRSKIAADIKRLYQFRSALVHAGTRSVSGSVADQTQILAESLYMRILESFDMKKLHTLFCTELSNASYGLPWPSNSTSS